MSLIAASVWKSRILPAPRIARRCPGRANEQTRFSSASERGRQRPHSAILAERAQRVEQSKWEETA
jgi:hypothetical protein